MTSTRRLGAPQWLNVLEVGFLFFACPIRPPAQRRLTRQTVVDCTPYESSNIGLGLVSLSLDHIQTSHGIAQESSPQGGFAIVPSVAGLGLGLPCLVVYTGGANNHIETTYSPYAGHYPRRVRRRKEWVMFSWVGTCLNTSTDASIAAN